MLALVAATLYAASQAAVVDGQQLKKAATLQMMKDEAAMKAWYCSLEGGGVPQNGDGEPAWPCLHTLGRADELEAHIKEDQAAWSDSVRTMTEKWCVGLGKLNETATSDVLREQVAAVVQAQHELEKLQKAQAAEAAEATEAFAEEATRSAHKRGAAAFRTLTTQEAIQHAQAALEERQLAEGALLCAKWHAHMKMVAAVGTEKQEL